MRHVLPLMVSTAVAVVFVLVVVVGTPTVEALSCPECTPERRANCPKLTCEHGEVASTCGCCKACGKGPGDECGGLWNMKGSCADGYTCQEPVSTQANKPPGVCVVRNA